MLYAMPVKGSNNIEYYIFLYDTESKSGFKELKNNVSLLSKICERYNIKIKLTKDNFSIANQEPKMAIMPIMELTDNTCDCYVQNDFVHMQAQPQTVREEMYRQINTKYATMSDEDKDADSLFPLFQLSLDDILELKASSKIDLPTEYFASEELASTMCSKKPIFDIPMTENQNSIQETNEDEISLALPTLDVIRESPEDAINVLTLINVLAPYRRLSKSINSFSYESKYHTPYFRLGGDGIKVHDELAKSKLSADFKWVYGNANNNLLPLQPNEEKLYNNLKTLYRGDISEYLHEILIGLLNITTFGMHVNRLVGLSKERALEATNLLLKNLPDFLNSSFDMASMEALDDNTIMTKEIISSLFSKTISLDDEQAMQLVTNVYYGTKVIDCDNNLIKPSIKLSNEKGIINSLIEQGFITLHFKTFITNLIQKAYRVNWGHTGTARAITPISTESARRTFDDMMSELLNRILLKTITKKNNTSNLFSQYSNTDDDPDDGDEDDSMEQALDVDEVYSNYPWYTSSTTRRKIKESINGYIDNEVGVPISSLDTESKIVERWRVVSGEAALAMYIADCYNIVNDIEIYFLSFIKLLRWGDSRKPTFLVFPEFPDIKTVFDLNESTVTNNLFVVDEKDLIKHNGCQYILNAVLRAKSKILNTKQAPIVGFLLTKDYGKVQKHYIASWSDLCQKCKEDEIDIDPLIIPHSDIYHLFSTITHIEKVPDIMEYEFFVSDKHIKDSHEFMCQASELSECRHLIREDVIRSSEYKLAIKAETITTNKERQYNILNSYILKLAKFYKNFENDIDQISTSKDFIDLLNKWDSISKTPSKREHNEAVAEATLQKMNLGTDNSQSKAIDDMIEKIKNTGKYTLVVDKECASKLPPLDFKDSVVKNISLKYYNRVILTVLNGIINGKRVAIISNIDNINKSHLSFNKEGQLSLVSYTNMQKLIKVLKDREFCRTQSATFYLQPSLREKLYD